MKVSCILCDRTFTPDKFQEKKLKKHPHRMILCPACHNRIAHRAWARWKGASKKR